VDAKRVASKSQQRLVRARAGLGGAWAVRAEDGRVRYAIAGFGLGLLAGSLLGNNLGVLVYTNRTSGPVYWAGWAIAPSLSSAPPSACALPC